MALYNQFYVKSALFRVMYGFPGYPCSSVEWVTPFHGEISDVFFSDALCVKGQIFRKVFCSVPAPAADRSSCAWKGQWHRLSISHQQDVVGTHRHIGDGCGKKGGHVLELHVFCDTSLYKGK